MSNTDLVLVGGGLANTLIALRLADAQPRLEVLLLEAEETLGGNHTWSFHGSDLNGAQRNWLAPLIEFSWETTQVRFPETRRALPGSYHSITSERLHAVAIARLGDRVHTAARVTQVAANHVTLADGATVHAKAVIDGRGAAPSPHLDVRFQKFVGQVVQLARPHRLRSPVIMDATEAQEDGYRFFYTLPFDDQTLLIEDTRYSDTPHIDPDAYAGAIERYAIRQEWRIAKILREERGVLPVTLGGDIGAFWESAPGVARSGLRAALFHPGTGYSLPQAVRLADELAGLEDWSGDAVYRLTRAASERLWNDTGFYRLLNRLLFLAAEPHERVQVLERFYRLDPGLIARFYAGRSHALDKARILTGKPPVPLGRALDALFNYSAPEGRVS